MIGTPQTLTVFIYITLLSAFVLAFRNYLAPLLFAQFTRIRVESFSVLTLRGLEYRDREAEDAVIPTLRVEKVGLGLGGWGKVEEAGLFVIKVEGLSFRVKRSGKEGSNVPEYRPSRRSVRPISC
jgi:hypothetical protein